MNILRKYKINKITKILTDEQVRIIDIILEFINKECLDNYHYKYDRKDYKKNLLDVIYEMYFGLVELKIKEFSNSIFFIKNGKIYFEYHIHNGFIWLNRNIYYNILQIDYELSEFEYYRITILMLNNFYKNIKTNNIEVLDEEYWDYLNKYIIYNLNKVNP